MTFKDLRRRLGSHETAISVGGILVLTATLVLLGVTRQYLNYGPETDYLGMFVPEAQRLLDGKPLLVLWHPPVYSIVIGMIQFVVQDWVLTGILLSIASAAATAAFAFLLFREIDDRWAAWGALVGLGVSPLFIEYGVSASTEMFFLVLFYGSAFLVFRALGSGDMRLWTVAGLIVGLGLLTRANGLSLVLLGATPLFDRNGRRFRGLFAFAFGMLLPLAAWGTVALLTGSPFLPAGTHANLAATYFSDRVSGDDLVLMAERFDSMWAVLTYDPVHMAKTYVRDLYEGIATLFLSHRLIAYPVSLLLLPGLLVLLVRGRRDLLIFLTVVVLPQLLLVNLKQYNHRYYLFLVPLFGACAGVCAAVIWEHARWRGARLMLVGLVTAAILIGARAALLQAHEALHASDAELDAAVPAVVEAQPDCRTLLSRKPHLGFYADCPTILIPPVESATELRSWLQVETGPSGDLDGTGLYLYFGTQERLLRPDLLEIADPEQAPDWLVPAVSRDGRDGWVLYRVGEPVTAGETQRSGQVR